MRRKNKCMDNFQTSNSLMDNWEFIVFNLEEILVI